MGLGRKLTTSLAYLAGVFDGEGHISIHEDPRNAPRRASYTSHAVVGMTNPEVVLLFWDMFPDATVSMARGTNFPIYRVTWTGTALYNFLKTIEPYLIGKRRQARLALAFLAHRRRFHRSHSGKHWQDCNGKCAGYAVKIRAIRKEAKGVNSVNSLLSHGLREYRAKREDVEALVARLATKVEKLLERVEIRDRSTTTVEPASAPEQDMIQAA